MSRPEKKIDWKRVDELLMAGCMGTEIAAHFDMHPNTFYNHVSEKFKISFSEYSAQKRQCGDICLREAQYLKALSGDNTMLVWLGKNRLKQTETPEAVLNEDAVKQFNALMAQLGSLQSDRKTDCSNNMRDNKS